MKFDRRLLLNFDWVLLSLVLGICILGILNIYSAVFSLQQTALKAIYLKQLFWIGLGLVSMALAITLDYRILIRHAYVIYGLAMVTLALVFVVGYANRGSQRWIDLGFFSFQPSELMKVVLILALAKYFDEHKVEGGYLLRDLVVPFLILLFPFLFILKQPDLGTALILLFIFFSITFIVGITWKSILKTICGFLVMIPLTWFCLRDYQKGRILTFLDPERDPLGTGYHIIQSIIAVGSGGLFGKGFLNGTQTQLKFLPEQQTDFIFSVFAEEWGFAGALFLMLLFLTLIVWGLKISVQAKDLPGKLISAGITMMIFGQVFINIGMVVGILPVVGIPLPFMSYGGSSMVVFMIGIGLILNVRMRRFVFQV